MAKYRYKAASAGGGTYTGSYIATSKDDVVKMIRANKGFPISVEEDDVFSNAKGARAWGIGPKDYSILCRQLYAMLSAGVPIIQSLNILRNQLHKKTLKNAMDQVYEDVQKGQLLSETMKRHQHIFPEMMINMIEAGEVSGSMDSVLERLSYHYHREAKISAKIKSAMIYPAILSFVAVAVVIFLLTFVMPTFVGMFESSGVVLPLPTRILMAVSKALSNYWYLFLFGAIGIALSLIQYVSTPNGRRRFDNLKLSIPVVKDLNEKIVSTRFARTLSTMLSSGIPLIQALENIERIIGNKVVAEGIQKVREEVQRGSDLAGPMSRLSFFPAMISSMVHVGEESGTLDDILKKTAEYYDEEVETDFDRVVALFEPIMIVVMGIMIGFIVISMALPMFDMTKTV